MESQAQTHPGATEQTAPEPVAHYVKLYLVGRRAPVLIEGDLADVLMALEPQVDPDDSTKPYSGERTRFGPIFRTVDRKTKALDGGKVAPQVENVVSVRIDTAQVDPTLYPAPLPVSEETPDEF